MADQGHAAETGAVAAAQEPGVDRAIALGCFRMIPGHG
jgi:hypothetical protein